MGSKWIEVSLDEISDRIGDGLHGTPVYSDSGEYFFINGNNLENGQIVFKDSTNKIDYEQYIKHKKDLGGNTILVSINGTIGNVALYSGEPILLGKSACYINLKKGISKYFIQFILSGYIFQEYIQRCSTGSTIKNVSLKMMREFRFMMPESEDEQNKSVEILKNLNQKITLNRQINQTLEQMAQTLFKSWFVDFDPVIDNALDAGNDIPDTLQERAEQRRLLRAKADFKPLPAETRALFPSEFEETELGWVPKGWEIKALFDLAEFINGAAYKAFNPNTIKIGKPIIKIAELKSGITESTAYSDIDMPSKYLLQDSDILFSWSGNPDTSIDTFVWSLGEAWLNQHIFKVVPKNIKHRAYVLMTLKYLKPTFTAIARDKQTTGLGHVTVKDLKELFLPIPTSITIETIDNLFNNYLDQIFGLNKQIQNLTSLRDALLPKLISGELALDALPEAPELAEAR